MSAPRSLTIVGIAALLWNLMGDASFVAQYSMDTAELAKTDPYTARIFAQMPTWAWAAFAVSVVTGTLGSILLLMRRAAAVALYLISLIAIIMTFGHSFFGTDMLAIKGWTATLFPALIFVLGIAQFLYARAQVTKGVLR
ncbi:sugar transporter [Sphingobium aromaticiconvertens]|uniref:sugar transporter n=1 Tax=Sphingobium aromaticiconvertens TaxID=365341 RepID=UPI003017FA58